MKPRIINEGRDGTFIVPDTIADWDAPSHWERDRLDSMRLNLHPGMKLVDVGTEHGWMTAVYGRHVGYENVVLCEPGPEMWQDVRFIWEANGFPQPKMIWPGFVGAKNDHVDLGFEGRAADEWPTWTVPLPEGWHSPDEKVRAAANEAAVALESPPMAYRSLSEEAHRQIIPTMALDGLAFRVDAITIDVEGAELEVMKGARRVLAEDRPIIWISEHDDLIIRDFGQSLDELHAFMREHNYHRQFLGYHHEAHVMYKPL